MTRRGAPAGLAVAQAMVLAIALAGALSGALAQGVAGALALLGADGFDGWQERRFDGRTDYALVSVHGAPAVRAEARGTASGMYLERPVSLTEWPLLRWGWRVDGLPGPGDERTREGDDFAARVYVIVRDPVFFWRSRALCYVWARDAGVGDSWENPFLGGVMVLALRGREDPAGRWREERRDVAADFRSLFGFVPERIDAVAIMTDGDQSGATVSAWYRGLRFERGPGEG